MPWVGRTLRVLHGGLGETSLPVAPWAIPLLAPFVLVLLLALCPTRLHF